jgi:hypothetical protein
MDISEEGSSDSSELEEATGGRDHKPSILKEATIGESHEPTSLKEATGGYDHKPSSAKEEATGGQDHKPTAAANGTVQAQKKVAEGIDQRQAVGTDHEPGKSAIHVAGILPARAVAGKQVANKKKSLALEDKAMNNSGLEPPTLASGERVNGKNKSQLKKENKAKRIKLQELQSKQSYWTEYKGDFEAPPAKENPLEWRNSMCPQNLALHHPAAETLLKYATGGCPTNTGEPWTKEMIWAAVEQGPHVSALNPEAVEQLHAEIEAKRQIGQCRVVFWDDIKDDPPHQLKISPIAMIPHKSRQFRAILDLSFRLRLKTGSVVPSVNEETTLEAPKGAIDQMGHELDRIIHAMAEADEDAKVFMTKFDIKDGFWRLDCEDGEEWNFAYVLPRREGEPIKLVVPSSLQMGWVESPPNFCAASETARDVAGWYAEMPMGTLAEHKFTEHAMKNEALAALPEQCKVKEFKYTIGVYVDDFTALAQAKSRQQLEHLTKAMMHGIHDVFPPDTEDANDPISLKKLLKLEGEWAVLKELLGFEFDGEKKTMILAESKRTHLLEVLDRWVRCASGKMRPIEWQEFHSVVSKIRHAFKAIPAGKGLLTPCNKLLAKQPKYVFLGRNEKLATAIRDMRTLLREASANPTPCKELVMGHPEYIGVKDASVHGVGGIIVGENKKCVPTVFRMEWPQWVKEEVAKTNAGKEGLLTNSDLEMAGMLLLFLIMEVVCKFEPGDHAAVFSDNSPTVSWTDRLAAKGSKVADQLVRALALRLKLKHVSPLTPLHIKGKENSMTDIPSRSYGSEPKWYCETEENLLDLFNKTYPLPNQTSWTVFHPSREIQSVIFSILRTKVLKMDELRRLPRPGKLIGTSGEPTANLWEWTLTYRTSPSNDDTPPSSPSQLESEKESTVQAALSELARYQQHCRPLIRRSQWQRIRSL